MRPSNLKRLYERYVKAKIPLHLALLFCVLSCFMVGVSTAYFYRAATGEAVIVSEGVGVYWDINGDNPVESLSWGRVVVNPLRPSTSKNVTFYVRNEAHKPIALKLDVSEWRPSSAKSYISLMWDYSGKVLRPFETLKVTLVLSVNSSLWFETSRIQYYSFDIVIGPSS